MYYKAKVREARIVRDHRRVVQRAIDLGKCVAVGQNKRFLSLSLSPHDDSGLQREWREAVGSHTFNESVGRTWDIIVVNRLGR